MTDERVARLYGLPLEEFTAARNLLAAELRTAGEREAAAAVKGLRKPTAAAWAVNQLVRAETDLVEALLGAGGELRQAHRQAASGRSAAQLRAAAAAERAAVDALVARTGAVLGRVPSAALLEAIRNTLHAASSDDEARELVASGTLTAELRPVGLGPARGESAAVAGARTTARGPATAAASPAQARAERERAAAERERATDHARLLGAAIADEKAHRRELEAAERALARADDAHARAREAQEAAAARTRDARARLRAAKAGLAAAQRTLKRLEGG